MDFDQQKNHFFNDMDLNQERTDIRRKGNNSQPLTKENVLQEFQILNNIPEINQSKMINIGKFIKDHLGYDQINLIAEVFPYQLYFQILLECPTSRVKTFALKHLSYFAHFSSFPFDELINSPCLSYLLDTLKQSGKESSLSPIINILTYLLKTYPECRDKLINEEILNALSDKLISPKIPGFLEIILTITPSLQPEGISQINFLYDYLLQKYLSINYTNINEVYLIRNTIYSIIHLLKMKFSPFDFSFVMNYIDPLLDSPDLKIFIKTVRLIGYIPFPTIQYSEKCIKNMTSYKDGEITKIAIKRTNIHTLLKVFIRKYEEWANLSDLIIESCLIIADSDDSCFNDDLLCLKVMFLYYSFNQYDVRVLNLLIEFINFPDVSYKCIESLIEMLEKAEFTEEEKDEFISIIESSIDDFQTALEEDNNDDVSRLISYFLQEIEQGGK